MTSLVKSVVRCGYASFQWAKIQGMEFLQIEREKKFLNKKFIEPIVRSNLNSTHKERIASVVTIVASAALLPQLAAPTFLGRIVGLLALAPGFRAVDKLVYQLPYKYPQISREEELAEQYDALSDQQILTELKNIVVSILPESGFYDDFTQDLIKREMRTSSVARGCVPMLIHYKLALEKYKALEEQIPLMEAIGNVTQETQKKSHDKHVLERLCKARSPFFKKLLLAKLEAAFALTVLCYPTEMKATSLRDLGQVNSFFLEDSDLEYTEIPFFIKKGYSLVQGSKSYRFSTEEDFISCKDLGDNSVQDFVEELKEINDSLGDLERRAVNDKGNRVEDSSHSSSSSGYGLSGSTPNMIEGESAVESPSIGISSVGTPVPFFNN